MTGFTPVACQYPVYIKGRVCNPPNLLKDWCSMKYDVAIVGAGSAGSVLAARLSEDPSRSVLLLEAGPDYPEFDRLPDELKYGFSAAPAPPTSRTASGHPASLTENAHNWQFTATSTDQAPPMLVPRGKVTGGSSAINSSAFYRGVPEDFDAWAARGNDEWSYAKVLPFFRKIETDVDRHDDYHGTEGPIFVHHSNPDGWHPTQQAFYDACRASGFQETDDHNNPDSNGIGPGVTNNHNGVRFSTALGYLSQGRHRLNLTVRPNCQVQRILFDGKRAVGLLVESGGETFSVETDRIILSAGAVGSPHLLLLSGVGPAEQLERFGIPVVQDTPGVGQNLKDHPKVYVTWNIKDDYPPQSRAAPGGTALRLTAPGSDLRNDLGISLASFVPARARGTAAPTEEQDAANVRQYVEMMIALLLPASTGELTLDSADYRVQPAMHYNYLAESFDRERLRAGIGLALDLANRPEFSDFLGERIEPTDADLASGAALDQWLRREATTYSHISCTCKMGPSDDPMAVVNQYGEVYGLEGLRVVDASIMPDLVRAPINPAVIMLAERAADLILQGD